MNKFYPNVFKPIKIRDKTFRNRVFVAPMTNHLLQDAASCPLEGYISQRAELAKNGAASVCFGNALVQTSTTISRSVFDVLDKTGWRNWIKFPQAVHFYGAKAAMEFTHFGHEAERTPGMTDEEAWAWGASDCIITNTAGQMRIKAMDKEIMEKTANAYADYAEALVLLGFDVMIIHGGHKTLFENFLSPLVNKRNDEFGGSLENRARFPLMVVDKIRERIGNKILLELRVSGSHYEKGGWDIDECVQYLHMMQDKIDIAHISAGAAREPHLRSMLEPSGFLPPIPNVWLAEKVKKSGLKIPVSTVGGFQSPDLMEETLAQGKADIINVGRGFLADPEFLKKAKEGRAQDIRTCIRCCTCLDAFKDKQYLSCAVNPVFGRADVLKYLPPASDEPKKVAVIGAGPAGMMAAIQASKLGNEVTVYEKNIHAGGMLHSADVMSFKYYLRRYKEYLISQFNKANIAVHFGVTATPEMIKKENYDVLIVAVGGEALVPPIKGIDSKCVMTAIDSYKKQDKVGKKVVVIGGGQIGCETALHYAMNGKEVSVLEMGEVLAKDELRTNREELLYQSDLYHINMMVNVKCTKIEDGKVYYTTKEGKEESLAADTIILAAGMKSLNKDLAQYWECAPEVRVIGDCERIGNIEKAITEGYNAGRSI